MMNLVGESGNKKDFPSGLMGFNVASSNGRG